MSGSMFAVVGERDGQAVFVPAPGSGSPIMGSFAEAEAIAAEAKAAVPSASFVVVRIEMLVGDRTPMGFRGRGR